MHGRNCAMTRSGLSCIQQKMMEVRRRGRLMTLHIQRALKQLKPVMKEPTVPVALRHQKPVGRRQWLMAKSLLSFRRCGRSRSRIWR
ncbi:hypothetical protein F2Q70_00032049 [Brassica cretica]|uniref:Uncharacterized protein n=1 Tax=Brassica cretica TaxID=69181 RepID=A0A8S9FFU4_BRACR|nr:hypothetical protein F2Q70_00032049 [Brassica cretica]